MKKVLIICLFSFYFSICAMHIQTQEPPTCENVTDEEMAIILLDDDDEKYAKTNGIDLRIVPLEDKYNKQGDVFPSPKKDTKNDCWARLKQKLINLLKKWGGYCSCLGACLWMMCIRYGQQEYQRIG